MKNERVPQRLRMVSFDIKSLFTLVPLKTIEITLERIYHRKEIVTILTKDEMKNLLLCTKNVHFTFNNEIYVQNHGVPMGLPDTSRNFYGRA